MIQAEKEHHLIEEGALSDSSWGALEVKDHADLRLTAPISLFAILHDVFSSLEVCFIHAKKGHTTRLQVGVDAR